MNYKVVSKIACRVLAVYVFMQYTAFFVGSLCQYLIADQLNYVNGSILNTSFLVTYIPTMVFSILLWIFSDKLAGAIAGRHRKIQRLKPWITRKSNISLFLLWEY